MVRRAQPKDIGRINNLLQQVLKVHEQGRPDIFIAGTTKYTDEELIAMFKDDTHHIFVYTDDTDTVRGYAFCVFEETEKSNHIHEMKTLYIDDICVDQEYRRHGIATELYNYVKAFAKESGCYHITLNVWSLNTNAQKFYETMGMTPLKTMMETII